MKNGSTTKTAARAGKGAKGEAKETDAGRAADAQDTNGSGAADAQPFIFLPPPRAEALSVQDTLDERGEMVCTGETTLTPAQMLELYRWLQLTRLVEEKLVNLYRQTKVVGGVFRSLGQEATAVGTAYALRSSDFISPLIRDLGAVLVKGIRPREIFAQYMAKAWGPSEGRDLNIHFGDIERGFVGPISHLGDMIPVMTGIALAARMQKKDSVAVAYIGDGGMSTGAFHEGLNFAAVQKLPLIIVAEHNWYAYSTPTSKQTAVANLADKAAAYGIPGYVVDGNDVVACYEVLKKAAEFAREGGGSVLIEAKTYRRKGHAEHDDQRYIPESELALWEKRDPLDRYHRHLISNGVAAPEKLDEIVADVRREVEEDAAWAESSPLPEAEKAAYNVFDNSRVPPAFRPKVLED
ncbi:MAG TPA: thiamine pyrophosphate-dependent dehydrogenase E1 component subunit alpha [Pyrinomonadaceae bacterium]|jgi:pyruvate dehydrogenase E1 component alpha subunit/2-oxoisovalerate dehydrogenase E1 component alpha subunit|nr:thiamine pyrophosphate-dependent dehydrogenase E1 component subunit alpha [Pyrinomonadaceae bacterium]